MIDPLDSLRAGRARMDREEQLPLPDAIELTCEIADALQCAHSHHIIHRDIKPENVPQIPRP